MQARGGTPVSGMPMIITAAHELKAPLALMRQLALGLQTGTHSPKDIERAAERMLLTSERALRLTTDLTRAARLEDSLFTVEPINPVALMEEVAHELAPLYKAKGRQLAIKTRHHSLLAVANRDLLRRILANFIDNALHYSTPETPVELSAQAYRTAQGIRLSVRDYGPAIPADIWKTLDANLGERAQTLHARPESSGLGMYVAGQFAGAMGASIGAKRHRDGSSFYVDLMASTQMRLL